MLKKFEEFINESNTVVLEDGVYGNTLFESIEKSFMNTMTNSINEGKINLDDVTMLEEGFITNWFKGVATKAEQKAVEKGDNADNLRVYLSDASKYGDRKTIMELTKEIKKDEFSAEVWTAIENLCNDAVELCEKLSKKEEEAKLAITKKLSDTKAAIDEFMEKVKATFAEIAEKSKNKLVEILNALKVFVGKLCEIATKSAEMITKGVAIAVCLPFVIAYATYKSVVSLCEKLCEKAKETWDMTKEALTAYGKVFTKWFKEHLNEIKNTLKEWADKVKEGADNAYKSVAKAYLYVVSVCGLAIDKASTAVKDVFNDFIDGAKEFGEDVKNYITDRYEKISAWMNAKKGEFVEGVKSVWSAFKSKVDAVVKTTKDMMNWTKDYAGEKIDDMESWADDKKKSFAKTIVDWAVNKWTMEEVMSWVEN